MSKPTVLAPHQSRSYWAKMYLEECSRFADYRKTAIGTRDANIRAQDNYAIGGFIVGVLFSVIAASVICLFT